MFNEKELQNVLGESDDEFKKNFDNVLAKLQVNGSTCRVIKPRLRISIIVIAVCAVFTCTAYGMVKIFVERADVGASWVLVPAPEGYYESIGASGLKLVYHAENALDEQLRVDVNTAETLSMLLSGKVFNANGEPIKTNDIMILIPGSDELSINTTNGALCDMDGEELWSIYYETVGSSEPINIWMKSKSTYEKELEAERKGSATVKLTYDYEEAAKLLGADFRLPSVYTNGLESPEFRYQKDSGRKSVHVYYGGSPDMFYFVEKTREESEVPDEWFAPGAIIEQCELEGTTIYKATASEYPNRYTWTHDDVVYMFFQDVYTDEDFTDYQIIEIIRGMIQ